MWLICHLTLPHYILHSAYQPPPGWSLLPRHKKAQNCYSNDYHVGIALRHSHLSRQQDLFIKQTWCFFRWEFIGFYFGIKLSRIYSLQPPELSKKSKSSKWQVRKLSKYCWWLKSGVYQLSLVVCPIIYKVLFIPGGDRRISEPSTVSRNDNLSWTKASLSKFCVWKVYIGIFCFILCRLI